MSAERKPDTVDELRRACQRWRMIALFNVAALAVVSVSLGTLLYGESAAKCEAWEQLRPTQQALRKAEEALELETTLSSHLWRPPRHHFMRVGRATTLEEARKLLQEERDLEQFVLEMRGKEHRAKHDLLRRLQIELAPESARPFMELLLSDKLKPRKE